MKNKIFYPYLIAEFILFGLALVASTGKLPVNINLFILISVSMNIPLLLTISTRNDKDKLFGLIFSGLMSIAVLLELLDVTYIAVYIIFIIAMIASVVRAITEQDNIFKKAMYVGPIILGGGVLLKALNILDWNYFLYAVLTAFVLYNIVIMIILYYKGEVQDKGNWFYGFAGMVFFLVWIGVKQFAPLLDIESQMYGMFSLLISILFIPSIFIINFSFLKVVKH